ncbi:universal stress protein [Actinospica sp.]|jgi:nucleotide-binding universal stress UspA family protein|uniref:universal stress protein n=1 Tax=Actinospica sp. TaxID=1872142 RepID=UPI002C6D5F42|nr:universal stress protein [Actinospica sp.]HWG27226.1 universal stress protein [Actinospica sp.]
MTRNQVLGELARVVVGVDGSDSARHAAVWAAHEAEARDVPLTVLLACGATGGIPPALGPIAHQSEPGTEGAVFVESVAALIRKLVPRLPVETELSPRHPVERLAELSGQGMLIVTGTRGHGAIAGTLLGSVSRALAARTRGPLVVVRGPRAEQDEGPVVLGLAPEPAQGAVQFAFAAAHLHGASLHAVRTLAPGPHPPEDVEMPVLMPAGLGIRSASPPRARATNTERDHAIERETAKARLVLQALQRRYPDVHVEITTIEGEAAEVLTAEGEHARLVVIGAHPHPRHGPLPARPAHVAAKLLTHCPAPVAVVPDAHDQAPQE